MKQSSNNTFNEGLNLDLNPITTPNNVLTDALNASFITFNGDELALQNDAGNTRIKILHAGAEPYNPLGIYVIGDKVQTVDGNFYKNITGNNTSLETDWENVTYVQLSDGFYPIGIKEYGGVLYIVSAKKGNLIDENNPGLGYDYQIEFGSYPSPEYLTNESSPGDDLMYDETIPTNPVWLDIYEDILYRPTIINKDDFKSGRYVTFDIVYNNTENDSYFDNISYYQNPVFYKIKLLHLLSNGYLDLTDDVWSRYAIFKNNTLGPTDFWFNDPTFRYFCPAQFKGKLAISLEIEPLKTFKLNGVPELTYDGTQVGQEYRFTISLLATGVGKINIPSSWIKIWIDDEEQVIPETNYVDYVSFNGVDSIFSFTTTFDASNQGKLLKYEIVPNLQVDSNIYTNDIDIITGNTFNYTEFPEEWRDNYIITGQRLISTVFDRVKFELSDADCENSYFTTITLTDNGGIYINADLEISVDGKYVFIEETTSSTDNVIATYTVVNGKPVINLPVLIPIEDSVLASLQNLDITTSNADCLLVDITINTNIPIDITGTNIESAIILTQGTAITPFYIDPNMKQFKFKVSADTLFTLTIYNTGEKVYGGYSTSPIYSTYSRTASANMTINHAFISSFSITPSYTVNDPFTVVWKSGYDIGILSTKFWNTYDTDMIFNETKGMYISETLTTPAFDTNVVVQGTSSISNGTWDNISDVANFRQLTVGSDTYVFANSYTTQQFGGTLATHYMNWIDVLFIGDPWYPNLSHNMGFNSQRQLDAINATGPVTWSIIDGAASASVVDGLVTTTDVPGLFTVKVVDNASSDNWDIITIDNSLYVENTFYDQTNTVNYLESVYLTIQGATGFTTWEIISGADSINFTEYVGGATIIGTAIPGAVVIRLTEDATHAYTEVIFSVV